MTTEPKSKVLIMQNSDGTDDSDWYIVYLDVNGFSYDSVGGYETWQQAKELLTDDEELVGVVGMHGVEG